jgi:hypothetical protein
MKFVLIAALLAASFSAPAQFRKTVELKPIAKQGFQYFYDLKRMRTPYALQMPLLAVEDERVRAHYRSFEVLDIAGDFLEFIPFIYLISDLNPGGSVGFQTFFLLWLGSIGANLVLDLFAHRQLRKGIDRYNQLIVVPSSHLPGLSLQFRF